MCEDRSGTFWIATFGGGLNVMDRKAGTFYAYRNIPGRPRSLGSNTLNFVYEDRSGVLWVCTQNRGLSRFDKRSETFSNYTTVPGDPYSLNNDTVFVIFEDRSRVLWLGTNGGGLNRFDRENKFRLYRSDPTNPGGLNDSFVYSIREDREGFLWIGTNSGGLNRFDRRTGKAVSYLNVPTDPRSLSNNIVRCVYEDRYGTIWAGTQGGGLNRFHPETGTFTRFQARANDPTGIGSNFVRNIIEDSSGVMWVGTVGGGLNRFHRQRETFTVYLNDPANPASIAENNVFSLYEAPSEPGILWVGTLNRGLNRFDTRTGTFTRYPADADPPRSLSHNTILAIHEDSSGTLWLGTYGGGLNKLVRSETGEQNFFYYTEKDGLPNNSIYGILEDPDGFLWISTNKGLSRFDPGTGRFKNYNVRDGLQGNEFNAGAYYKNRNGEMFFGGLNGINAFHPFQVRDNPHVPPVVITGFRLFNKPVDIAAGSPLTCSIAWTEELRLNHKQNALSFEFAALDFTIPQNNSYAYKMEGLDEDWNTTGSRQRYAAYTNMTPGEYVFRVIGSNNDGTWNRDGASIKIVITPPFWQTLWFQLAAVIAFIVVMLAGYRRHLRNERLKTELQTARDAQMSIMPQSDPRVEGFDISGVCVPASEVGGDFFDYIWMDEAKTKLGIAIGDVSGKAMKSAMTAVMTSGMIYLKADESISVREIMERVNRPLYLKTARTVFTALCLASIHLPTRELVFSNAGLPVPLLKPAGSGAVSFLEGEGEKLPLGIKIDTPYREKKCSLKRGDLVVFYTDGITDERNNAGEFYGTAALVRLLEQTGTADLTAKEIKERIIADVNRFSGGAPQHDDFSVVVVKVI
jgi:ligand-binding sensor domain-containing protein